MEDRKHAFPPNSEPQVTFPSCWTAPAHSRSEDPFPATFITRGGVLPASQLQLHTESQLRHSQGSDSVNADQVPALFRWSSTPKSPRVWSTQMPWASVFFTRTVTAVGISGPQRQEAATRERTTVARAI